MRRHLLIVAAAAIAVQPMASLPVPEEKAKRGRPVFVVGQIVSTGCAVDTLPARAGIWNTAPVLRGNRGAGEGIRPRIGPVHDRCVPRRECFTDRRPEGTGRILDNPFRTPPLIGR